MWVTTKWYAQPRMQFCKTCKPGHDLQKLAPQHAYTRLDDYSVALRVQWAAENSRVILSVRAMFSTFHQRCWWVRWGSVMHLNKQRRLCSALSCTDLSNSSQGFWSTIVPTRLSSPLVYWRLLLQLQWQQASSIHIRNKLNNLSFFKKKFRNWGKKPKKQWNYPKCLSFFAVFALRWWTWIKKKCFGKECMVTKLHTLSKPTFVLHLSTGHQRTELNSNRGGQSLVTSTSVHDVLTGAIHLLSLPAQLSSHLVTVTVKAASLFDYTERHVKD